MDLFAEILSVFGSQWSAILRLLAVFGVGLILTFGLLKRSLHEQLDTSETFALALAGWPLWWVLCAFLAFFVNRVLDFGLAWAPLWVAVGGLLLIQGWKKVPAPFGKLSWMLMALILAFLGSFLIRLAFLAELIVPSYFDGALHYSLSQHLLTDFGTWPWESAPPLVNGYYHLGFHLLVAVSAFLTNIDPAQTILIVGQILLAVMPFPVFFIVKRESGSTLAAFFALLLAGWGWNMPTHALDWGKYPALAGLLALQLALALAFLATRSIFPARKKATVLALFLVGSLLAALMHSRSLVVIGLVLAGYLFAGLWSGWPPKAKWAALGLALAALGGLIAYLESRDILKLVFDPYLRGGLWMTLLVLALSPFAFRRYERLALTSLLTVMLLLACLLVPLPAAALQTLLDRPFVQMMLYLPLALLGGLGLAGLGRESFKSWRVALATVAVLSAVFIHLGRDTSFSPSPCCLQFKSDDAVAVDWMKTRLLPEAHILIAGNTLSVFDIENPAGLHGSDGGAWITPLTGRQTSIQHYRTDFGAEATFSGLCQLGVTHIYVGDTRESFSLTGLQSRPGRYLWQFSLPGAHLFQLAGCP